MYNTGYRFSRYPPFRDVAQLVARDVWDVDAAGSNPVISTKISPETDLFLLRAFIVFLPQLLKNIPHKRELLSATQEDIDKAKFLIYNVRKQI